MMICKADFEELFPRLFAPRPVRGQPARPTDQPDTLRLHGELDPQQARVARTLARKLVD